MYTILVCDDDADIRAALRIYLSGEGYAVREAENGTAVTARTPASIRPAADMILSLFLLISPSL